MHTSISAADMLILDSSLDPMGMRADLSKKVKVWLAILFMLEPKCAVLHL